MNIDLNSIKDLIALYAPVLVSVATVIYNVFYTIKNFNKLDYKEALSEHKKAIMAEVEAVRDQLNCLRQEYDVLKEMMVKETAENEALRQEIKKLQEDQNKLLTELVQKNVELEHKARGGE